MTDETVYTRVSPKLASLIEQEAKKHSSKNVWAIKAFEHYLKCGKTLQYKGFVQRIMSEDFICFLCPEESAEKKRGTLAMFDSNTGACMCIACSIEHKMTTKSRVKLYVQELEARATLKALKHETRGLADEYLLRELKLSLDLNEAEMAKAFPEYEKMLDELHSWALRVRVTGKVGQKGWQEITTFIADAKELLRDHKRNMEKVIDRRKELVVRKERKKAKKQVRA